MSLQKELIKSLQAHGEQTAIEYNGSTWTYSRLFAISKRITNFLLAEQAGEGTVIGISLSNRVDLICSMIGILNARCIFVVFDGSAPQNRQAAMIKDLNMQHMILSGESAGRLDPALAGVTNSYLFEGILEESREDAEGTIGYPEYSEADSIYVYFTSGSTGVPKGIVGRNGSLLQFIRWEIDTFGLDPSSRVSQFITPHFDAFLRDVFAPLLAGGTLCIPPSGSELLASGQLSQWIDQNRVSLIHCVPSFFRLINTDEQPGDRFAHLRYVLLSGERITPGELSKWYDRFGERIQLVNLYGPTEGTMIRSYYLLKAADARLERIPIGKPIRDTELRILTKELKPCNLFVSGDVYLYSKYLTKGYLNAPELTQEKFIHEDASGSEDPIAFRTGDIARKLADGNIDLIGREDRQVKIRGIRVELDEVEQVLVRAGFIRNAVVLLKAAENGNGQLIAFVILQPGLEKGFDHRTETEKYLRDHLPDYMIPSSVSAVTDFPLLSNGKIDHKTLLNRLPDKPVVAPVNETEARMLNIWKEVLGPTALSTEESFLGSGGNSLSIMKLIGKIYKEFNVRIPLSELFDHLTIKKQAEYIRRSSQDHVFDIRKAEPRNSYHLSSSQERIYYNYELNREGLAYNLPMAWQIHGPVETDKIEAALNRLIGRQNSLRTAFTFDGERLVQVIRENVACPLEIIEGAGREIHSVISEFVRPFDLGKAPLFRCGIILNAAGNHLLVIDIHHIICDGQSQMNLIADFLHLYAGNALAPLPIQYTDYAEWEHDCKATAAYLSCREFWLSRFEGEIPRLELPVTTMPANRIRNEGGNITFTLERRIIDPAILSLKEEGVTTFSILFAMFFVYLSQITGQEDIVIGINSSGRIQDELADVIGMFAKTLPIRFQIDPVANFREAVVNIHKHLVEALGKQMYDLTDIAGELNRRKKEYVRDLFDVMFVFQNFETRKNLPGAEVFTRYEFDIPVSKYPITLFASEEIDAFEFRLEYSLAYFSKGDAEVLVEEFKSSVKTLSENVNASIIELSDIVPSTTLSAQN